MRTSLFLSLILAVNLPAAPIPESAYQNGLAIGCQAYSFKEFSAFEAIAKTKEAGGKIIEFYPGQKLRPESPAGEVVHHNASAEVIKALKDECARQGISPVNYGVVGAKNADDIHKIMEFAKTMGLYSVCSESTELVAAWESAAKEFDIKVAFHEHGGSMSNPKYKVWNPLYILGVVESRDPRIGACADLGHYIRSGERPVEVIRLLKGRLSGVHLKDFAEMQNKTKGVILGRGHIDVPAVFETLVQVGFPADGALSVEYEENPQNPLDDLRECHRVASEALARG